MVPTPQHQGMMTRVKDSQAPGSTRTRIENPSIAALSPPHVQQRIARNATSDRNGRVSGRQAEANDRSLGSRTPQIRFNQSGCDHTAGYRKRGPRWTRDHGISLSGARDGGLVGRHLKQQLRSRTADTGPQQFWEQLRWYDRE